MEARQKAGKRKIVDELKQVPIIQHACQRAGVPRATYYRWRKEDDKFAMDCEKAMEPGVDIVNDLAESQLLIHIKAGNLGAIIFWLKNRHKAFKQPNRLIINEERLLRPMVFFDLNPPDEDEKKKSN